MIMKKILSISLFLASALTFVGCSGEEEDLFNGSAAERLNDASAIYSARLTAQPNGWAMQYYPTYDNEAPNGKGYLLLTRFNKDFTVDVSGYDWPYWSYEKTSTEVNATEEWVAHYYNEYREATSFWEVITDNGPVLSFNSYNENMHYFSDPDFRATGTGFGGDYEFIVVDAPDDASYMMLKGKKRGTYNLLTPIEEGIVYADYMADVKGFHNSKFPVNELVSNLVHFGDSVYRMDGSNDGLPNIYPYDADAITNENFNPFLITKRGDDYYLRFRDPFERDDMEGVLQELRFDPEADKFVGVDNADFQITGYNPALFIQEKVMSGSKFQFNSKSVFSDKVKVYYDKLTSDFADLPKINKRSYSFMGFNFVYDSKSESYLWNVLCRVPSSSNTSSASFIVNLTREDTNFKMEYGGPLDDAATSISERLPYIIEAVKALCQEFKVTPVISNFNLSQLRLTSVSDPDFWFEFNVQ